SSGPLDHRSYSVKMKAAGAGPPSVTPLTNPGLARSICEAPPRYLGIGTAGYVEVDRLDPARKLWKQPLDLSWSLYPTFRSKRPLAWTQWRRLWGATRPLHLRLGHRPHLQKMGFRR